MGKEKSKILLQFLIISVLPAVCIFAIAFLDISGNLAAGIHAVRPANLIIMLLALLIGVAAVWGFYQYSTRTKDLLISKITLREKERYLAELEKLNLELQTQKDAYARLWEETSILNTELFEKNKSLNEQKQFIEALWEETSVLNEELLQKNAQLSRLNRKVEQDKQELLLINTIGEHMVSSSGREEVLSNIVALIKRIISFSTAVILGYNPVENTLDLVSCVGYEGKSESLKKIRIDQGLCGYAAQKREIVLVNDVTLDERYISGLEETRAELDIPLLVKDELIGVLSLQSTNAFQDFAQEQELILKVLGKNIAMVMKNHQLTEAVRESFVDIVKVLIKVIEAKDIYTSGHCERVKEISLKIGRHLDLEKSELETLELAALLHDIGKIGMPEEILNKKGKLTKGEYELIKKHPVIGYSMLEGIYSLERINKIILQHHERIDGTGYPQMLRGDKIDILAKILAVADAIDAMTSARPYRTIQSLDYVLEQLDNYSGSQFDKKIAAVAKIILIKESFTEDERRGKKTV
ncbi:MAG: HD domain-containing phosphohydrolase [Peptococcaceae bacterium]